jgi:hypothetical protein
VSVLKETRQHAAPELARQPIGGSPKQPAGRRPRQPVFASLHQKLVEHRLALVGTALRNERAESLRGLARKLTLSRRLVADVLGNRNLATVGLNGFTCQRVEGRLPWTIEQNLTFVVSFAEEYMTILRAASVIHPLVHERRSNFAHSLGVSTPHTTSR